MSSKYIELNHELKKTEVNNRENVPISSILQKIGQRKTKVPHESVIGSEQLVYSTIDWGFLNTILVCYNNHWILKTTPEDWWSIIVGTVATAVDQKSELPSIRKFFVSHEGKKEIRIIVQTFTDLDYSWLFTQFAEQIAANIRHPEYVTLIEADFTTTSPQQLITSQIMVMASVQKYFDYVAATLCGIPGVEMTGSVEDWEKLVTKLEYLRKLLDPIVEDLELAVWFSKTKMILDKLLETYNGVPDRKWWSQILSYNSSDDGSDQKGWWSGWMAEFLRPDTDRPVDFTSGVVSVPLVLIGGRYEDTGNLVAGTVGYTIEESTYNRPSIKTEHGLGLILPKDSPLTPIIVGEKKN